jgi:DNA polymerase III epsilon subunit-like protein
MEPTHMKVFLMDLECTGSSRDDKVCELALIECRLNIGEFMTQLEPVRRFETLVNPLRPISRHASAIHEIYDRDVKQAPTISAVLPAAFEVLPTESFHIFGHDFPKFDMRFIDYYVPKGAEVGCTLRGAKRFIPDMPTYSLDRLLSALEATHGVTLPAMKRAHSAMGDCERCLVLINYILSFGVGWELLVGVMTERLTKISFGQYKGRELTTLPETYVNWLLSGECDSASWELRRALREL